MRDGEASFCRLLSVGLMYILISPDVVAILLLEVFPKPFPVIPWPIPVLPFPMTNFRGFILWHLLSLAAVFLLYVACVFCATVLCEPLGIKKRWGI